MTTPIDELYERIPHIDHDWANQAIRELALRDVSGADIGAAMLEVESHMAEHGGDVRAVFGDPKAYAAALELPDTEKLSGTQWVGVWLPAIVMFVGLTVLYNGIVVIFGGGGLSVLSVGIVLIAFVAAAAAIVKLGLLRFMVARPVVSGLALSVVVGSLGVLGTLLPGPELDLAPAVSVPAGAVLFVSGLLLLVRLRRRAGAQGITFPSG